MGREQKKWVFTTSSQTDFTTTNLKVFIMSKNLDSTTTRNPRDFTTTNLRDSTTTKNLNKVFTTINSRNRDFTTTNQNKASTTNNLRDSTTMLDFTMTRKTRTVFTTTSKKTVSTTRVSTTTKKTVFTTTTILSKKMVSTTKTDFTMTVRMLSPRRKRAKKPSLSLESQDANNCLRDVRLLDSLFNRPVKIFSSTF